VCGLNSHLTHSHFHTHTCTHEQVYIDTRLGQSRRSADLVCRFDRRILATAHAQQVSTQDSLPESNTGKSKSRFLPYRICTALCGSQLYFAAKAMLVVVAVVWVFSVGVVKGFTPKDSGHCVQWGLTRSDVPIRAEANHGRSVSVSCGCGCRANVSVSCLNRPTLST
jgi:hypothetical protein